MNDLFFTKWTDDMAETMRNLFDRCSEEYEATIDGCDEIIRVWKYNKGDRLDELFKNVAGFDPKNHWIKLDDKLCRAIDVSAIRNFFYIIPYDCREMVKWEGRTYEQWCNERDDISNILYNIDCLPAQFVNYHEVEGLKARYKKVKQMCHDHYYDRTYTEDSVDEYKKRSLFINFMCEHCQQFADDEVAEFVNREYPELKAVSGQKMSKLIRKWCVLIGLDKWENFEREYAKFSDAINPLELNETLVFSWNPMDYLTMSFGTNWTSCHSIDKFNRHGYGCRGEYGGCKSSGVLSYMLDQTSVILYTIKKDEDDGTVPLWNLGKVTRQMFHIDFNTGKLIVQGRLYPNDQSDAGMCTDIKIYQPYREIVQRIVSQAFDIPNLWKKNEKGTSACCDVIDTYGTHYPDYEHYGNCNVSKHTSLDDNDHIHIIVGHDPICPSCGNEHDEDEWCTCEDCRDGERHTCADCGRYADEDDLHWVENYGYCCENCCSYCDYHDEWERADMTYITGYGSVCEWGIDDMLEGGDLYECAECGDYVHYRRAVDAVNEVTGEVVHFCSESCRDDFIDNNDNYVEAV